MVTDQHIWPAWAHNLHRWGLANWVATLLESAGPLNLLAAQFVYLVQPLASSTPIEGHLRALSELLEDTRKTQSFISYLREEQPR